MYRCFFAKRFSFTCVIIMTNSKYAATAQDHLWSALSSCCVSCSAPNDCMLPRYKVIDEGIVSCPCLVLAHDFRPGLWTNILLYSTSIEESKFCQTPPNQEISGLHCLRPCNDRTEFSIPTKVSNSMSKAHTQH